MMAEFIIQNVDLLYEEIISTVTEEAPDTALTSHEIHQLQTLDSLGNAMRAVAEFEERTTSSYIVLEKQKHFGNEAFRPSTKVTVHWEGPVLNEVCLNDYCGVPFIIVGRKVLGCHLGKDRAVAQKKRYAESTKQKETADNFVRRRKLIQHTKKIDCPAKIYIYHILKFPDFQIKKKTDWQMRAASKKLRGALEHNIQLRHNYVILLPPLSHHNTHSTDGKVAHIRENIDPRVIQKITELFKSGISKKRVIKKLVDSFVRCELFLGQDLPANSRRFFPTTKDIGNIMRRCSKNERKRSVAGERTVIQLCAEWQQENQDHSLYCRPQGLAEDGKLAESFMLCYQTD